MGIDGRVLLIVIDGAGVNRTRSRQVAEAAWQDIPAPDRRAITEAAQHALASSPDCPAAAQDLAVLSLYPVHAETLEAEMPYDAARALLAALKRIQRDPAATAPLHRAARAVRRAAMQLRFVPWAAQAAFSAQLRNDNLTMPTSAAGQWAGFEDLDPPVQGNSETGHQQIGNLVMAPQMPLHITRAIESGDWLRNRALLDAIDYAARPEGALNFTFLLSGTTGQDGRVHSAWNHLEAFVELVFRTKRLRPGQVRMQAILDGRDSPPRSSLQASNDAAPYIDKLQRLLASYSAEESLAWVVGRSTGMDRDYREVNAKDDYMLLTAAEGIHVDGFDGVRQAVAKAHGRGDTDQDIPPIAVRDAKGRVRTVGPGQSFVDLNFRSDRQRAKIASLCGAVDLLREEAGRRGREWKLDWLKPLPGLHVCGIVEYHPDFAAKRNVTVAFPAAPHRENLLAIWPQLMPNEKYLLVAESIKAPHVGYFIRGRREAPELQQAEDRIILPSAGEAEGILSDTDFHRIPRMRNAEVAATVSRYLAQREHRLICCNLSATDMLGHLLPGSFEAAITALEATDAAIEEMATAARRHGWNVIVTADHGNIEEDGPAHSANDVLTTVAPAQSGHVPAKRPRFQARLFDVSWTVAHMLGAGERLSAMFKKLSDDNHQERYSGRSLIA